MQHPNHAATQQQQQQQQPQNNSLQAQSVEDLLKNLYSSESIVTGYVYKFLVVYRYMLSSLELSSFLRENFLKANA